MTDRQIARWSAEYKRRNQEEADRIAAAWEAMSPERRDKLIKAAKPIIARGWFKAQGVDPDLAPGKEEKE